MSNSRDGSRRVQGRGQGAHGFQDPFGGFTGRSLFQDFFGEDPFSDPFFTQPFGGMFGSRSAFGPPGGFFGPSLFGGGFVGQQDRHGGYLEQMPHHQQPELRRGPVIEEVTGDHDLLPHSRSSDQPIVEHPDDEVRVDRHTSHPRSRPMNLNADFGNNSRNDNTNSRSYSYQSAAVTYGGTDGPYYSSSMRRRAGPNGIVEEELEEKDSSGKEEYRHTRGLGNKGHSSTRKRNADGREHSFHTLHNLTEEETTDFNRTWELQAATSLPNWDARSRTRTLPSSQPGSGRSRAILPSSGGSSSTWSGSKQA